VRVTATERQKKPKKPKGPKGQRMGTPNLSISSVDLTDGVEVYWNSTLHRFTAADILAIPGNQGKKEDKLNEWAQEALTRRYLIADYEPDHRYRQDPPVLYDYEYVDGNEICIILCYVEFHIFDLGPTGDGPVNLTVRFSKEPITGEWW
jgi:hypothetical protein